MPGKILLVTDQGYTFIRSDSDISQITNSIKNQCGKQPAKTNNFWSEVVKV